MRSEQAWALLGHVECNHLNDESDHDDADSDSDGISYLDKMLVVVSDDGDAEMTVLTKKWGSLNLGAHSV